MGKQEDERRRTLFAEAIASGSIHDLVRDTTLPRGEFVVVIADTTSQPGKSFLHGLLHSQTLSLDFRRELRELRASSQTVNFAFPAKPFLSIADQAQPSVGVAVRRHLQRGVLIPVVVMAAGSVMTVGIMPFDDIDSAGAAAFAEAYDGQFSVYAIPSSDDQAGDRERARREERRRRHGMN